MTKQKLTPVDILSCLPPEDLETLASADGVGLLGMLRLTPAEQRARYNIRFHHFNSLLGGSMYADGGPLVATIATQPSILDASAVIVAASIVHESDVGKATKAYGRLRALLKLYDFLGANRRGSAIVFDVEEFKSAVRDRTILNYFPGAQANPYIRAGLRPARAFTPRVALTEAH